MSSLLKDAKVGASAADAGRMFHIGIVRVGMGVGVGAVFEAGRLRNGGD